MPTMRIEKKTDEEILVDLKETVCACVTGFSWEGETPVIEGDPERASPHPEAILDYFKGRQYLKVVFTLAMFLLLCPRGEAASMSVRKQTIINITGGGGGPDPTKLPLAGGVLTGPVTSYSTLTMDCSTCALSTYRLVASSSTLAAMDANTSNIGSLTAGRVVVGSSSLTSPSLNIIAPNTAAAITVNTTGATTGSFVTLTSTANPSNGVNTIRLSSDGGTTTGKFSRFPYVGGTVPGTAMFNNNNLANFAVLDNGAAVLNLSGQPFTISSSSGISLVGSGNIFSDSDIHLNSGTNNIVFDDNPQFPVIPHATALCIAAGNLLGHCTTAPLPGCTCVAP